MKYGIKEEQWDKLLRTFATYPKIEKVILYGSRAKGNYKPYSDIDITLIGTELKHTDLNHIISAIDNLLLPYQCDVSLFHSLSNPDLIDHINRVGIEIYKKQ